MVENKAILSVIVPTKDRPDSLRMILSDIAQQEFKNFECIVIDDGSSNENKIKYQSIFEKLDFRFRYVEIDNKLHNDPGPSRARNFGIRAAVGKFIAFCDDDDRWIRSDHLNFAVDALEKYNGDLFFAAMRYSEKLSDQYIYSIADKFLRNDKISENLFNVNVKNISKFLSLRTLHCDTIVVKKSILFEAGLYYEKIRVSEDREFSFRLVDCCDKILFRSDICAELNISPHSSIFRTTSLIDQYLFAYQASIRAIFMIKNSLIRKAALKTAAWDMIMISEYFIEKNEIDLAEIAIKRSILTYPSFSGAKRLIKLIMPWRR